MSQDLSKLVQQALEEEYGDVVQQKIAKTAKKVAKKTVKQLKNTSPKRKGDYRKGWASKEVKTRLGTHRVIHNKKHYRLIHLLEKGHQNKDGTRTKGIPHLKPAEEFAVNEFEKELIKELEKWP